MLVLIYDLCTITFLFSESLIEMMVEEDTSISEDALLTKFYNPGSTISLTCLVRHYLIKNATVTEMTNLTWQKDRLVLEVEIDERMRFVIHK